MVWISACETLFPSNDAGKNAATPKRFRPAWKARRAEIKVLAHRAAEKKSYAERVCVLRDTTLCKSMPLPRDASNGAATERADCTNTGAATEHADSNAQRVGNHKGTQIAYEHLARHRMPRTTCAQRVLEKLLLFCGMPLPWNPEHLHISEGQAHSATEILHHLDMSTEARNVAKERALKYKNVLVEDDQEPVADRYKLTVEELWGTSAEEFVERKDSDTFRDKEHVSLPEDRIFDILKRKMEREMATRPGRPRDQHKEMQRVADIFGADLEDLTKPHATEQRQNRTLGTAIGQGLSHQKEVAERIRQQQEASATEPTCAMESAAEVIQWDPQAEVLLQSIPQDLKAQGPLAFAKHLAVAATLNKDQKGVVRLVADAMEKAWLQQGRPETMERHGAILRLLLVGGGGCGKSRIINLVLAILFRTYWGVASLWRLRTKQPGPFMARPCMLPQNSPWAQ